MVDQDLACIRMIEAHQAFDDSALAGAVLSQQSMERTGRHFDRNVVESLQGSEVLGDSARLETRRSGSFCRGHFFPRAPGIPASLRLGVQVAIMTPRCQQIGRGVEQVVIALDAQRLQRRPERLRAAEKQRRGEAPPRTPLREDNQRDRHQPLPSGDSFGPDAGEVKCKVRAADRGERAADRDRDEAHRVDIDAERAGGLWIVARRADLQSPAGTCEQPVEEESRRDPDKEERADAQRGLDRADVAPVPSSMSGNCGAMGATKRLPKKKASPLPKMIIAMPAATSFTAGCCVSHACSAPSRRPTAAAASTPSHGEPVRSETPKAVMAPISRTPSMPRLILPLFSVRHSPG